MAPEQDIELTVNFLKNTEKHRTSYGRLYKNGKNFRRNETQSNSGDRNLQKNEKPLAAIFKGGQKKVENF